MSYLEENQLVAGQEYLCIFYCADPRLLKYVGNGVFENGEGCEYSLVGEIRYVVNKPKRIQELEDAIEKLEKENRELKQNLAGAVEQLRMNSEIHESVLEDVRDMKNIIKRFQEAIG
jgi:hypothetical protein